MKYERIDIMIPAHKTPNAIIGNDFFICKSINAAINAPVHAPVPGNGMATNIGKPSIWYLLILSDFACARVSSQVTIFVVYLKLSKNLSILRTNSKQFLSLQQLSCFHS